MLGIAFAALGLGLSTLAVKETREHARFEAAAHVARADGRHDHLHGELTNREVFTQTSFREPALSSACQAGLVNNLNDGLAWGLLPILFAAAGLSVGKIGLLAALYPAVWGAGQLLTGALSDRWGRRWMIAFGMWLQAIALGLIALADTFAIWAMAAVMLGAGPRWSTQPCSRRSETSHTRAGVPARSAPTVCGETAASRSAHCSPVSSPTPSASVPLSGPSPLSPRYLA